MSPEPIDPKRLETATHFLQEAVFRSRSHQAAPSTTASPTDPAGCGLGKKPAIVLELDERGIELFAELWPTPPDDHQLTRIHTEMRTWIQAQDAFDRKRNHFMKDFRNQHGFDRGAYAPEILAAYESGLAAVNENANRDCRQAAERLLTTA